MKKLCFNYICFLSFFSFFSCNNCELLGETSLGNNFTVVEADKDDISIIYCTSKKCCTVGILVVPSKVVKYKSNDKWIIAKSKTKAKTEYWLIDKEFKLEFKNDSGMEKEVLLHATGPLDSTSFYQQLSQKKVDLNF